MGSNIPTVFSWGSSISSDSFLPSVLLWLVIIIGVVDVTVVVIVAVVVAVVKSSSVVKLSFVITCPSDLIGLIYSNRLGVCIPPGQGVISQVDLTGDEDSTDEDGDIRMGDSTGVLVSLGGGISLGGKKSRD
ncbi:hypothetical protein Tco_0653031 [Tanacetum coccineum]|uniref:Transmembrane protein n=1 Tax=Tanacetum coccineum TaxID=301880 RepID=A0ABQ4WZ67_9ASTR